MSLHESLTGRSRNINVKKNHLEQQ